MAGTEAEELERIADVLDGTTTTGPLKSIADDTALIAADIDAIRIALEKIEDALDGTTTNTPALQIDAALDAIKASLDSLSIDVTNANAQTIIANRDPLSEPGVIRGEARARSRSSQQPRTLKDF